MKAKIYHNPRCTKSRQTLALLEDANAEIEVVEYLKAPPSPQEINDALNALNMGPREIMRTGEAVYKELGLKDRDILSRAELVQIMAENPILIERPIVITAKGAAIGRPPENVKKIL